MQPMADSGSDSDSSSDFEPMEKTLILLEQLEITSYELDLTKKRLAINYQARQDLESKLKKAEEDIKFLLKFNSKQSKEIKKLKKLLEEKK